jgi:ceramide glucosyltransferase
MTAPILAAATFCIATTAIHVASIIIAILRFRGSTLGESPSARKFPPVSMVRPLCGIDNYAADTLRSTFDLDYPRCEILFCVASAKDPVVPLVEALMAEHPEAGAKLLIGDERVSSNPKLNNVLKGWRTAQHDWIIIADSNVLMPRDYIERLFASWRADTGLVASPPIGCRPQGLWAELECAFLNTYQARWQYLADSLGFGFAQGKTMLWRRETLEAGGGIEALGAEIAEDAAATKLIRAQGLNAHLVDQPFQQPLGRRRLRDVWSRQLRWARLRRATFPFFFVPEILTTGLLTFVAAAVAAPEVGMNPVVGVALAAAFCYSVEALLAFVAGWPLSWRSPAAWLVRDVLLPFLWARGWTGDNIVWRGNAMNVEETVFGEAESEPRPQI